MGLHPCCFSSLTYIVQLLRYTDDDVFSCGLTPISNQLYSVEITSSYPAAATGSYSLAYVQSGGGVSNGSLTSGQSYNGTLSANGLDSFQFTGTSGQGVLLYSNASYTTYIILPGRMAIIVLRTVR